MWDYQFPKIVDHRFNSKTKTNTVSGYVTRYKNQLSLYKHSMLERKRTTCLILLFPIIMDPNFADCQQYRFIFGIYILYNILNFGHLNTSNIIKAIIREYRNPQRLCYFIFENKNASSQNSDLRSLINLVVLLTKTWDYKSAFTGNPSSHQQPNCLDTNSLPIRQRDLRNNH